MIRNETTCIAALAVAAAILVAPAAAEDDDDPKRIDIAGALGVSALSGEAYASAWGWVRAGGDPNFVVARPGGETVMHAAAVSTIDLLQALIAAGGDCDRANARGASPLHFAAAQKDIGGPGPGAITLLTQCGADPNRQDERGATPLHAVFRTVGRRRCRAVRRHRRRDPAARCLPDRGYESEPQTARPVSPQWRGAL